MNASGPSLTVAYGSRRSSQSETSLRPVLPLSNTARPPSLAFSREKSVDFARLGESFPMFRQSAFPDGSEQKQNLPRASVALSLPFRQCCSSQESSIVGGPRDGHTNDSDKPTNARHCDL